MKPPSLLRDGMRAMGVVGWAVLLVPLLVLLLVWDRWGPEYIQAVETHQELLIQSDRAQALADLEPRYREKVEAGQAAFGQALSRAYVSAGPEVSVQLLADEVRSLMQSLYIDPPDMTVLSPLSTGQSGVVGAEFFFRCVPQQLNQFETRLALLPKLVRATSVAITVVPDSLRASQQLEVRMTLQALHATATDAVSGPTPSKTTSP